MADVIIQYNRYAQSFNIYCYVQLGNTPQTGLSDVTINAFKWDSGTETRGIQVITNQILSEINPTSFPGWYSYVWTTFDFSQNYVCDFKTETLGPNAIDIEYFNIAEIIAGTGDLPDLLIDIEEYELFKLIMKGPAVGIIEKI